MSLTLRQRGALLAGKAAGAAARRTGRGGGTALPGVIAGGLAPGLLDALGRQLGRGAVTVTGTNGKTTTAHLLTAVARAAGLSPLVNRSGSNLERGLVSVFAQEVSAAGTVRDAAERTGIFEVDEAALPSVLAALRPRVALFLNLFRDQLDRYGEVESVAEGWRRALGADRAGMTLVLNADDPLVASLGETARGDPVPGGAVTFGVEDRSVALPAAEHASDARFCGCGSPLEYEAVYMGHVGAWRCPAACGRARPAPEVAARSITLAPDGVAFDLVLPEGTERVTLSLAGLHSVYNALAAVAGARALGIGAADAVRGLREAQPAFGRQEPFHVDGREVRVLLAKNPAGMNEALRTLLAAPRPLYVLAMLNDGIQDGRDVSWVYDVDFEMLADRAVTVVAAGTRAEDLALRLALAGVPPRVVEPRTDEALREALALTPEGGRLDVVATYTAMLEAREALATLSGAAPYWESPPGGPSQ